MATAKVEQHPTPGTTLVVMVGLGMAFLLFIAFLNVVKSGNVLSEANLLFAALVFYAGAGSLYLGFGVTGTDAYIKFASLMTWAGLLANTGAVAHRLRRRFIGFEREREYADAAEKRIAAIEPMPEPSLSAFMTAREAPRVPFATLLERGLLTPGAKLVDAKRRHRALVRADGAVSLGEAVGSIHRIGALAQGLDACNGWTFWHVETPKGLTVIDTLRAKVRAEMGVA